MTKAGFLVRLNARSAVMKMSQNCNILFALRAYAMPRLV